MRPLGLLIILFSNMEECNNGMLWLFGILKKFPILYQKKVEKLMEV